MFKFIGKFFAGILGILIIAIYFLSVWVEEQQANRTSFYDITYVDTTLDS